MSDDTVPDCGRRRNLRPKSHQEILKEYYKLRGEQRVISNKLSELEFDLHEHKLVMDTLKDMKGERKCFKLVGGILCERTVQDVLPEIASNKEHLTKVIDTLHQQLMAKAAETSAYRDEHRIIYKHLHEVHQSEDPEPSGDSDPRSGHGRVESVLIS